MKGIGCQIVSAAVCRLAEQMDRHAINRKRLLNRRTVKTVRIGEVTECLVSGVAITGFILAVVSVVVEHAW